MRAVAIFGRKANENDLQPFHSPDLKIPIAENLSASPDAEAGLILGGDGTVHRHLVAFVERKTPMLVVPHGSGNDFAVAVGVRTRDNALAAWKKFQGGEIGRAHV